MDRHSFSGYVFFMGGSLITWSSKRQSIIALSTAKSEYIAAVHAAKEIYWLRSILEELGNKQEKPTVLKCDNQSAIALCKDSKYHARTKHMDIRYHFIRESVKRGKITVSYIPTDSNIADIMTKGLTRKRHAVLVSKLGLRVIETRP
jgi:hypothetical protein